VWNRSAVGRSLAPIALLLGACWDWDALEPRPMIDAPEASITVAPSCVAPGSPVAVRWSGRACSSIGWGPGALEAESGCAMVPIAAAGTLAIECGQGEIAREVFVDDPGVTTGDTVIPYVDPVPDADLSEWDNSFRVQRAPPGTTVTEADLRGRIFLGWNETGLVFAADIDDDKVETVPLNQGSLFRNDGIEILVDGGADGNSCAESSCPLSHERGEWQLFFDADGRFGSVQRNLEPADGVVVASTRAEQGYLLEGVLPWALFLVDDAGPLRTLRIELAINDRDDGIRDEDAPPALLWDYIERHHRNASEWRVVVLRCGTQNRASCE
jgi:hypothetical protein